MSQDEKKSVLDRASHDRTVLLVEDHADSAEAIELGLASAGYKVVMADSVRSALSHADEQFDVVVSDLGLPDGSGLDVMRALQIRRPVFGVALSGFGAESDVRASREAGFQRHLVKPVDLSRLIDTIPSRRCWHRTGSRPRADTSGCAATARCVRRAGFRGRGSGMNGGPGRT
jgi:DNA-binding response OmpR family regulator